MSIPNFFDLTDEAQSIDKVLHDFIEVISDVDSENKAVFIENTNGELKYIARLIDRTDLINGTIAGENNQFLLSDGEGWAKSSGLLYQESSVDFFDDPRFSTESATPTYFSVKAPSNLNTTFLQIIVTEIGANSEETVLYDMSTDENLSDILTGTNEYLTGIPREGETLENCFIINTVDHTIVSNRASCAIGIQSSLFDSSKRYRIEISTSSNDCIFYCCGVVIKNEASSLVFDTATISALKIKTLFSPEDSIDGQFVIKKGNSINDSYYFTMSGTTRFTMHDNSKMDITKGATVFLHGSTTLQLDDGLGAYTGPVAHSSYYSDSGIFLHDKAIIDMSQGSWLKINGAAAINMTSAGSLKISDNAKEILEGDSVLKLSPDNGYSPYFSLGGGAIFVMNADRDFANKASAMFLEPDGLTYISDGASGVTESYAPNVDYSSLNREPETMFPGNKSTAIKIAGETYIDIDTESGASTYIKISGDNNSSSSQQYNSQACLILTGNIFQQMSGNAHSEMHNDSKFIMRGTKTTPYWKGEGYISEPVQQGVNGPILGMYGKPTVTIGSYSDEVLELSVYINKTITDPDITAAPSSYEDLSEAGKAIVFGYVSGPENTVTSITINSSVANPNGGYDIAIGTVYYSQHPVTITTPYSGTRNSVTYSEAGTAPASFEEISAESLEKIKVLLGFTSCVSDLVLTGGTIGPVNSNYFGTTVTVENLTYTCTANPASFLLPKQEDNPRVAILNNADVLISDSFSITANQDGISFSDGTNSESFTIAELTALKALLS